MSFSRNGGSKPPGANYPKPIYTGHAPVIMATAAQALTPITPVSAMSLTPNTTPTSVASSSSMPVPAYTLTPAITPAATPVYYKTKSLTNLRWLKSIFATPAEQIDQVNLPAPHWIFEPENFKQTKDEVNAMIPSLQKSTRILALCEVNDEYYNDCIAPTLKAWQVDILALQNLSEASTAHLISTLPFHTLQVVSLMNVNMKALGFIYAKLLAWQVSGKKPIRVFCGEGISPEWKEAFAWLGDPNKYFEIYKRNLPTIVSNWLKAQNNITKLIALHQVQIATLNEKVKKESDELEKNYEDKIQQLSGKLERRNNTASERKKVIANLHEKVDGLEADLKAKKKEIKELKASVTSTKKAEEKQQEELTSLQAEVATHLKTIQELSAEPEKEESEVDSFFMTTDQEVKLLRAESSQDKQDISELETKLNRAKHELSLAKAERDSLKDKDKVYLSQKTDLQNQIDKLTLRIKTLEEQNQFLLQLQTVLTQDKNAQAKALEEAKKQLDDSNQLNTDLQEAVNEMETVYKDAITERDTALTSSRSFELELKGVNEQLAAARESNRELEHKKDYLKKRLKAAEKEVEEYSDDEHSAKKRKREDGKDKRDYRSDHEEAKKLKKEVDRLKEELAQAKATNTTFAAREQAHEEQCKTLSANNAGLSVSYYQSQRELTREKYKLSATELSLGRARETGKKMKLEHRTEIDSLKDAAAKAKLAHEKQVSELKSQIEFANSLSRVGTSPALTSRYLSSHATHSPLGSNGLFSTAMSISPMFGNTRNALTAIPPLELGDGHDFDSFMKSEIKPK